MGDVVVKSILVPQVELVPLDVGQAGKVVRDALPGPPLEVVIPGLERDRPEQERQEKTRKRSVGVLHVVALSIRAGACCQRS